jgi:hypothetical protein
MAPAPAYGCRLFPEFFLKFFVVCLFDEANAAPLAKDDRGKFRIGREKGQIVYPSPASIFKDPPKPQWGRWKQAVDDDSRNEFCFQSGPCNQIFESFGD